MGSREIMLGGVPCDEPAFHSGGSRNISSHMLTSNATETGINSGNIGRMAQGFSNNEV